MYYVYILRSVRNRRKTYVGATVNLIKRVIEHNLNKGMYTKKYTPWKIEIYIAIDDKEKAFEFEKYLKSESGKAFLKKRLLS